MVDFDHFQNVIYLPGNFVFWHLSVFQPKGNVIKHCHMGENGIILKYHSHIPLIRRDVVYHMVINPDFPSFNGIEADNHTQKRGLPTT